MTLSSKKNPSAVMFNDYSRDDTSGDALKEREAAALAALPVKSRLLGAVVA